MIENEERFPFEKDTEVSQVANPERRPDIRADTNSAAQFQEGSQINQGSKATVVANKQGVFIGENIEAQFRIAKAHLLSRLLPNHFNTVEKVLTGMQLAYELGLKPLTGMRQMAIINGTPSIWGELPLGLCFRSGFLEFINEIVFTKDGTEITAETSGKEIYKAVCTVKRKGYQKETTRYFSLDDAKQAGLLEKNGGVWQKYTRRMLQCRARSWALKDTFPDVLGGISIAEYDHDVVIDNSGRMIGGSQQTDFANELNKTFLQTGQEVKEESKPDAVSSVRQDPK